MKLLAIDTATERCSVALLLDGRMIERSQDTQRGHADLILPMIAEALAEGGVGLRSLDGVAYGRGPGAFTGVRIAIGVVQGLAYGIQAPTVGVSDLAAIAQQVAQAGEEILVCMDARMGEVYWARFRLNAGAVLVEAVSEERVDRPDAVARGSATAFAGTGFKAYPQLAPEGARPVHELVLPRAREIALLAEAELRAGRGLPAAQASPVYLRDQVASVNSSS
jgi:tRNA threonylcarbamoyladenosine biosynthesis protein TsaB